MAKKQGKGYGKKMVECGYSHNAPSLAGYGTGLSAHPNKAQESKLRGKRTVLKETAPPNIFASYL
jgi:hypothetical protein